jgi:hypothetical protein
LMMDDDDDDDDEWEGGRDPLKREGWAACE